jgi:RecA/RadA recombinase
VLAYNKKTNNKGEKIMTMKTEKKSLVDLEIKDYLAQKESIKTNILPIDMLFNFTPGEIIQLVGETQTGKTTLSLQIAHNFCKQDKNVLFLDTKNDITIQHLENTNLTEYYSDKHFIVIKEFTFKKVEKMLEDFISTGEIDLIIIDSLPSLINDGYLNIESKSIKSDNNNTNYGTRPLMLLINKLKKLAIQYNICLLFVNEFRNKIDPFRGTINKVFGPKNLEYESNKIIQIRPSSKTNKKFKEMFNELEEKGIGKTEELVVLKNNSSGNKLFPFFFEYGKGYDVKYLVLYALSENKYITKTGKYYSFKDTSICETDELNFIQTLEQNGILIKYAYIAKDYYNQLTINK